MSIPPLVCSTPPPPDQCEDDKDTEEYDLHYNLSQEDDESVDYDFGSFSTYNHCESPAFEKQTEVINIKGKTETSKISITKTETVALDPNENITETNEKCEEKLRYDEDVNIEDLDLKIDEPVDIDLKDNTSDIKLGRNETGDISLKDSPLEISNVGNIDGSDIECLQTIPCIENVTEIIEHVITESDFFVEDAVGMQPSKTINDDVDTPLESLETANENDFDDFQFIRSDSKVTEVIETCDNPWESQVIDDSDFGDFTANFEDNKNETCNSPVQNVDIEINNESNNQPNICSDESDFGDFDSFQSSAVQTEDKITQDQKADHSVHVLNIQTSDDEPLVMENINKLLSSIFDEEIIETEDEMEVKLESLLTETWGYLIETDIRQPYIVNWNNSLGQKTLLRALCIDSRNILFGPKWGHSMPKYAANLSVAPLQPKKQLSPSNIDLKNDAVSVEKSVSKSGTWTDPFTTDGQEFTYAEALLLDLEHLMATLDQIAHNQSTLKISELLSHACNIEGESSIVEPRPTDIDVFEGTMSSKSEKIYSSTIDIQPIRQINLPETHIFTPTDSETPRSKTTHYNCGPPVLLPQKVSGEQLTTTEKNSSDFGKEEKETEDEEWEFQGFTSTTSQNSLTQTSTSRTVPSMDINDKNPSLPLPIQTTSYQTQVLQPIKIEPTIPTLNWPDPGEVKHVFEDFTDFISNASRSDDATKIYQNVSTTSTIIKDEVRDDVIQNDKNNKEYPSETTNDNKGFDDDFDTFQSALPPGQQLDAFKAVNSPGNNDIISSSQQINNNQVISTSVSDFEHVFQKINNVKSDSISFTNNSKSNEPFATNFRFTSTKSDLTVENSLSTGLQPQSSILQPLPANNVSFVPNQSKSGQILQPLSLESYSQINWPSPGIDLQDLSRFNPVDTLHSLKNDLNTSCQTKNSPLHNNKNPTNNQIQDDDVWGEFVSSKPKQQLPQINKNQSFNDDDEWTDFVSSSSIKPQNGLNTISLNVHTNSNMQKNANKSNFTIKNDQLPVDIPTLNYITPKTSSHKTYNDRHFQNL